MSATKTWYAYPKGEAHKGVALEVDRIRRQQSQQRREMAHHIRLYANGNVSGLGAQVPRERLVDYCFRGKRASRFNMVAAGCDTALSMIASNPPVPTYTTTGGDFALMRKAEKRSEVLQSQVIELTRDIQNDWALDAFVTGTGIVHGYLDDQGLPAIERVHPLELLCEHADGLYCAPRSLHRVRLVSKEVLKALYPKYASQIDKAAGPSADAIMDFFLDRLTDRSEIVEVVESHHLRSGKRNRNGDKVSDGRHCITLPGAVTLLDEEWDEDEFPYVVLRYRKRSLGFWGAGLAESAREPQNRINDLIERVTKGQDLASTLIIANPNGENAIHPEHLSNDLALILNYDPTIGPPQLMKWDGTLGDLQQQIDLEFERWLITEGLAESQVVGEGAGKGLSSGVAQRAADDIKSRRLVDKVKRFESACLDVAKLIERLNDQAAMLDEGYEVRSSSAQGRKTFLRTSRWTELAIPEGQANIAMAPMSALPTTPAGKYAAVMDWISSGFIDRTYALKLLNFPDLDSFSDLELAGLDLVQHQISRILDGEVGVLPDPRQDLTMVLDVATKSKFKAMTLGAPDDTLDQLEAYLQYAESLMPAPPAPMDPSAPMAVTAPVAA